CPVCAEETVLHARRSQVAVLCASPPERVLDLRQQHERRGERQTVRRAPQTGGGPWEVAARRVESRESGEGLGEGGNVAEGLTVRGPGRPEPAAHQVEVTEEALDVGAALRTAAR